MEKVLFQITRFVERCPPISMAHVCFLRSMYEERTGEYLWYRKLIEIPCDCYRQHLKYLKSIEKYLYKKNFKNFKNYKKR